MSCNTIDLGGGDFAIVCTRGGARERAKCDFCGVHIHARLCDFPLRGKKSGRTCSKRMCIQCTKVHETFGEAPIDLCPPHARFVEETGGNIDLLCDMEAGGSVFLDELEERGKVPPTMWKPRDLADWLEAWNERAAIGEYERGMTCEEAEREAYVHVGPRPRK